MIDKEKENTHTPEMGEMERKIRTLEMDMDRLERRTKSDRRLLRIMTVLWIAMTITSSYALSMTQGNNRELIKMEQEYTAIHKEHDALIEEILSTHKEMDQQLAEEIQSLKEKYDLKDEEAER